METDFSALLPVTYMGELVLTTKQLAEFYGCTPQNIVQNFLKNQEHFVEGKHYFKLVEEDLQNFKKIFGGNDDFIVHKFATSLYLWKKRGAARHAKMLSNERAWEVFEALEDSYFDKEKSATDSAGTNTEADKISIKHPVNTRELSQREKIEVLLKCLGYTDAKYLRNKLVCDIGYLITGNKIYR